MHSEFNKGCMDDQTQPTDAPIDTLPPKPTEEAPIVTLPPQPIEESPIVTLPPQPTEHPGEGNTEDKLPILWMERFMIVISGTFIVASIILFLVHLVKKDWVECPKVRAIVSPIRNRLSHRIGVYCNNAFCRMLDIISLVAFS